jgi:hypothetical protein
MLGKHGGLGPDYPWSIGFAKDVDSYRNQERGTKQKEEEEKERNLPEVPLQGLVLGLDGVVLCQQLLEDVGPKLVDTLKQ